MDGFCHANNVVYLLTSVKVICVVCVCGGGGEGCWERAFYYDITETDFIATHFIFRC